MNIICIISSQQCLSSLLSLSSLSLILFLEGIVGREIKIGEAYEEYGSFMLRLLHISSIEKHIYNSEIIRKF